MIRPTKILFAFSFIYLISCKKPDTQDTFAGQALDTSDKALAEGRALSQKYCTQCHILPEPNLLNQESNNYTLSYMGLLMGFDSSANLIEPLEKAHFQNRFRLLKATQRIPQKPAVSREEFHALRNFFLAKSLIDPSPPVSVSKISGTVPNLKFDDKVVTLLKRIPGTERMAIGGGMTNSLQIFDSTWNILLETSFTSPPVDVVYEDKTYYVVTLGDLLGGLNSLKKAELWAVSSASKKKLLSGLTRSTQVLLHDMNGDGRKDFLISSFGNQEDGELAWYDFETGKQRKHTITENASVVRTAILSKPGKHPVQIAVLKAGAREQLMLYTIDRQKTESRILDQYPPSYGSVWLEAADLDADGNDELLVLSGDNADCGPHNAIKPYQGLRVYSMTADAATLRDFYPIQGALSMSIRPPSSGQPVQILVLAYYADLRAPRDVVILTADATGKFHEKSYFMNSRPTVGLWLNAANSLLIGSGNIPLRQRVQGSTQFRQFNGPALQEFTIRD